MRKKKFENSFIDFEKAAKNPIPLGLILVGFISAFWAAVKLSEIVSPIVVPFVLSLFGG